MPHFFIKSKNVNSDKIVINDKENYNHIAKALRIRKGEKLLLIDENRIQYETTVFDINSQEIIVNINRSYESNRVLTFDLYLAQSPLRSDAQSFVIEKATELGVRGVYPIHTDNCAISIETINKKIEKWQRIMLEASKQCERADVPTCFECTNLDDIKDKFDRVIVFCERIASKTLRDIPQIKKDEKILVIIGPEGGFSEREFDYFKKNNFSMLTLGDLILRAETAVTVALGNVVYEFSRTNK